MSITLGHRLFEKFIAFYLYLFELSSRRQVTIIEKKATSRPFSQALDKERILNRRDNFITRREDFGFEEHKEKGADEIDNKHVHMNGGPKTGVFKEQWHSDVIELRKKADAYKVM